MDGTSSGVFYRNFKKHYPVITRGHGMYLYDSTGRRYLDAVGGAGVVVIGHGVPEITAAMAERAEELCFVYSATFSNQWQEELANALLSIAPKNMRGIWFVSGGSEANETAVKMARQYHLERGNPSQVQDDLSMAELSWYDACGSRSVGPPKLAAPIRAVPAFSSDTNRATLLLSMSIWTYVP